MFPQNVVESLERGWEGNCVFILFIRSCGARGVICEFVLDIPLHPERTSIGASFQFQHGLNIIVMDLWSDVQWKRKVTSSGMEFQTGGNSVVCSTTYSVQQQRAHQSTALQVDSPKMWSNAESIKKIT